MEPLAKRRQFLVLQNLLEFRPTRVSLVVLTVTLAQVQIRTACRAQTGTIFTAEHFLGQPEDNKLPNVLRQIHMSAVSGNHLDLLAIALHSIFIRDIHDTVFRGDVLLKLFKTSVACEGASSLDLHPHVELPACLLKRRLDLKFFGETRIEAYFFRCCFEGMMMSTVREFRNIESEYAHRPPLDLLGLY